MMRVVAAVAAVLIGLAVATVLAGSSGWNRSTATHVALLAPAGGTGIYDVRSTDSLPPPAARYFRHVLRDGQPFVGSAIASQEGEFFLNNAWRRMTATQQFATDPPGFVWDARIEMAWPFSARVRDSYVAGTGQMTASLWGIHTLVDQRDVPELNAGALQRFLGEAVWMPTALLSDRIRWTAVDDRGALATLTDRVHAVSLRFAFDDSGMVTTISGDRYQEAGGAYSVQPWLIRCDESAERSGMIIPLRCEVSWVKDGRPEPYWRGRITSITYR
jgi:hypothetical protein